LKFWSKILSIAKRIFKKKKLTVILDLEMISSNQSDGAQSIIPCRGDLTLFIGTVGTNIGKTEHLFFEISS
jgi:hypothetical protein